MQRLILAIFVVYRKLVNQLYVLGTCFSEHPNCTNSNILWFLFLLIDILVINSFGLKFLLNTLKVKLHMAAPTWT